MQGIRTGISATHNSTTRCCCCCCCCALFAHKLLNISLSLRIAGNLRVIIYGDVLPTLSRLILWRKLKLLYLPYLSDLPPSLSFSTVCLSVGLLIYLLDQRTGESGEQMCLMSGRTNKIVDMLNNNNNKCNLWHCFLFSVQATTQSPPVLRPQPQSQSQSPIPDWSQGRT